MPWFLQVEMQRFRETGNRTDWNPMSMSSLPRKAAEKEILVEKLLEFGYDKDHVLMIGDAPSDLEAAERTGSCFIRSW